MADNKNPGYIEQLREMRALRTQQLRGMTADQRFYTNTNSNQRALLQASQKLGASFDSMSKTFVSGIRGLTNTVGSLVSKGASTAGNVAGGAASVAGSITSGIGKVLPFAIAGLVGKMLIWDNLTSDNKNRLTSSVARLFSNLFGDLPDMFKGIVQRIVKSVSDMDINFPILTTLMQKTETFIKMFSAGIELAKLKFEDLMEFFGGIKDPAKLFEMGMKAVGAGTLARLLLPATVSLVTAIIGNKLLMGQIGGLLDSRLGGLPGGGRTSGGVGGRVRRAGVAATAAGAVSAGRVAAGRSVATKIAARIGARLTSGAVLAAIPVVGELALLGYTAYEIYEIAKELGFTDNEAEQLSQEAEMKTEAMEYYGPRIDEKKASEIQGKVAELEKLKKTEPNSALSIPEQESQRTDIQSKIDKLSKEISQASDIQEQRKRQKKEEDSTGGDIGVQAAFYRIWNTLKKEEKQFAIDYGIPIIETENYVYMMGKDRKISKMKIDEYTKMRNELDPLVTEVDRAEFERMTGNVIKKFESAGSYNQPYSKDDKGTPFVPLPEGKTLTTMTGSEVLAYQQKQVEATRAAKIGMRDGKFVGTGAMGAYQINQGNLAAYYADPKNAGEKDKLFDEEQQDKIYRWLIKGAVDNFMATNDKEAFKTAVINTWEAFKPKGSEARKQLDALLNNPVFAESTASSEPATKEQRKAREKFLMKELEILSKETLNTSGDYRPMLVGNTDVAKEAVTVVKDTAEKVKDWLTNLIPDDSTLGSRAASFFGLNGDQSVGLQSNTSSTPQVNIITTDNSVKVASTSGGGGGGSAPSMSVNSVTNKPYFSYYQFMAGGNPAS